MLRDEWCAPTDRREASRQAGQSHTWVPLGSYRRHVLHGFKPRLNGAAHSSVADWFALNSNELTWIALATVGVIAVGMLM